MKTSRIVVIGLLCCLAIYLFATRPAPLADIAENETTGCHFDTRELFTVLNDINDAARSIYTKRIVGEGLKAGLKFGEDWNEPGVEKGPLPALFLRLTAAKLEAKPPPVGLYLGSDAPINASNLFSEGQAQSFQTVRATRQPVFSGGENGARLVAMYPDVAGVAPCVTCHNDHPDSAKTDWQLNDVMGATTWTYPRPTISAQDALAMTDAMLASVKEAYSQYLTKTAGFAVPIEIGRNWPGESAAQLPTSDVFMAAVEDAIAPKVFTSLIKRSHAQTFTEGKDPCNLS